jgi:DNA-binding FadR family transcriptional regulator
LNKESVGEKPMRKPRSHGGSHSRTNRAAAAREAGSHAYRRVAESIRIRILRGELKPGDRLPNENELARDEGVGRTTVREALRLLAAARLIETRRGVQGGAFVTHPNADDLNDLMLTALSLMTMSGEIGDEEMMEATAYMMPTTARIAALKRTDEEASALCELAEKLQKTGTDEEWVDVGGRFNKLLIKMSRNRVIAMFVMPLMLVAPTRYRELRLVPGWRETSAGLYRDLAQAIRRRAPAAAEEAMLRLRRQYVPRPNTEGGTI